ncbi:protein kinase [Colletotrichum godetiae]|uniref:Protein kinase n=1 Tax=Colletotrichum godetiae TaxID=1209918 RepID=A0AAJ0A884_9PEZI|nr:protein kinase [Colletotrichum godetiae]KAK1657698.1 protein kinase [Colletotrichum godetiae]
MAVKPDEVFKLLFQQEKLVLDNRQRVTHIYDRGEFFRLKSEQQNHPIQRTNGVSRRSEVVHFERGCIENIAGELDDARTFSPVDPEKCFIPRRKFNQIMTLSRVRSIVHELHCFRDVKDKDQLAMEIRYGSLDGTKSPCVKLLAILIAIDKAEDMERHMAGDGLRDICLPLNRVVSGNNETLRCRKHGEYHFINSYRRSSLRSRFAQWTYSLYSPFIKWEHGKHHHYLLDTGDVLPMETVDQVKEEERKSDSGGNLYGGFSEVYKVKIYEDHFDFGVHGLRHPQGYFALKKLTSHSRDNFNLELSSLVSTAQNYQKKHIIQLLATFEVKNAATRESTFYLLFDWADGTLNKFWQSNQALVRDKQHCEWMATQFYEVCEALRYVHNDREPTVRYLEDRDSNKQLYGRHGDIKPGNILWFRSKRFPHPGTLALADFGLGRLHTQVSRSKQDPNNLERTATYRCPEFDLEFGLVSPRSDIFSLGCVFLEYVTWFLLGVEAVDETFSEYRMEQDKHGFNSDVFFSIKEERAFLKGSVITWIAKLQNHRDCSWYIWELLEVIRDRMLDPESKTRIPSSLLSKRMKELLKACTDDSDYYLKPKR